jgi:hypothetical protein
MELDLVPGVHFLESGSTVLLKAIQPTLDLTGNLIRLVNLQFHAVGLWKLPSSTHPSSYGLPRISRIIPLGPQAVQPTHPIALTGGGE